MKSSFLFGVLVHSTVVEDSVREITQEMGYPCHIVVTSYETALDAADLLQQGCAWL